jgi:transposase InsO family protein
MNLRLHKNATTTPRIRAEIQAAPASVSNTALAKRYGVTESTIKRWRGRTTLGDASHRPKTIHATLPPELEEIVVELRRTLLLPLDDLLVVVREFLAPSMSRASLDRLLRRYGVSRLADLVPVEEEPAPELKRFKEYLPGYIHVDVKFLPQMPDQTRRSYLFVAVDRATRWVYHEVLPGKSAKEAAGFLKRLVAASEIRIQKVLTDNGGEFTDRFRNGLNLPPTGKHAFDRVCAAHSIEHRLIPPQRPQTNGMVERYNGRITVQLKQTRYPGIQALTDGLDRYGRIYNGHIPQRALNHRTPLQAMADYYKSNPECFHEPPPNLPGPDT